MSKRTLRHGGVVVASLALALTACGGDGDDDGVAAPAPSSGSSAGGDALCAQYESFGDLDGTTVSIYTSIVAPEEQSHIDSYKPFEQCTGVTVEYEGNKAFENQLQVRVQGGNAPDVAFVPQPGLLQRLKGSLVPAPPGVEANVDEHFSEDWKNYGTIDGTFYAAPLGSNVKSFVWYSPTAFEENGYEVPTTWDEMIALSDQIATDHPDAKPWCAGFGSGDATGWTGTDWIEDIMLRTAGPDVYDQWVNHEIPFNAPQVAEAFDRAGSILKNEKYVNGGLGGVSTIATTEFTEAGKPILDGTCFLHRQASFYGSNLADEGATIAEDGDVFAFPLPAIDESMGQSVLGAGEFVAGFADRPEVNAFRTYLSSPEWANTKAKLSSGWVTANTGADPNNFANPIDRLSVETLQNPEATFRFDASDLMPAAVGAGSFWTGMVDWVTGSDTQEVLNSIEESWPAS